MIEKHAKRLRMLPLEYKTFIRSILVQYGCEIKEDDYLHDICERNQIFLCDIVILVARSPHPDAPTVLAELTRYQRKPTPPAQPTPPTMPYIWSGEPDTRRVRVKNHKPPCFAGSDAYYKWGNVKDGITVTQLKTRGVTQWMLRDWVKSGHMELVP